MGGFVFFLIFIFIIIPIFKNIIKNNTVGGSSEKASHSSNAGSAGQKNWTQVQKLLQEQMKARNNNDNYSRKNRNQRDKYGHTKARQQTHDRMHSRDGNRDVFPEAHKARAQRRQARSRKDRQRMEAMLHSRKNRAIYREGNQGVDNWGARGDNTHVGSFLFFLLFGLIALLVLANVAPDIWREIMQVLNLN